MKGQMKKLFSILFFILLGIGAIAADKQKIVFFRPTKKGMVMRCRLSAMKNDKNTCFFADIKKPDKASALSVSITAEGQLKVLEVLKSGHAGKIEFTFSKVTGLINNKIFQPDWQGKTIIADMTVRPICKFSIKDAKRQLARLEIKMLSLLFHPAPEENMGDYIGTDKKIGLGDKWEAKTGTFVKLFKKQGLIFDEKHIKGNVSLKGRRKFEDIDCWEIEEKLDVEGVAGFIFHFSLSVFLPVKDDIGNVKMTRKAFMQMEKVPEGKHFMTSGIKKIKYAMTDTMTAIMLPVAVER